MPHKNCITASWLRCAALGLCRHIIIIGGNHDSASFLNAPKSLLSALNVHVIGASTALEQEVLVLKDHEDKACAIVCAVPYLRDRDVRMSVDGESSQDKSLALVNGIKAHYRDALALPSKNNKKWAAMCPSSPWGICSPKVV
jgi:exonuclease SbcD